MKKRLKQLMFVSLFLLFIPVSGYANTPGVNGYNAVPNPNEKIIPKNPNQGYTPSNVQESRSREASEKKKAQEKRERSEKAIAKDTNYETVKQAADRVDKVLGKKKPSVKELEQAARDIEIIRKYVSNNGDKADTSQIQSLRTTIRNYEQKFVSLEEDAKKREEAAGYLQKAKNTTNPADLSKLTSYIYLEEGFFGLTDVFPKVVNALVQGFFFITKAIYCLVIIILEQVFSANAYESLDSIVSFSAQMFQTFIEEYQWLVYALAVMGGIVEFIRKKHFPFKIFRFLLVWFLALFLYRPASLPLNFGNQKIEAKYNLSQIIKVVDGVSSDLTRIAIAGFNNLDKTHSSVDGKKDNLTAVKESIFDELVYQPFLALNFTTTDVPEDKVRTLFETTGNSDKVKDFSKENSKISQLSWSTIGVKVLTALASLIKAIVVGVALILIGVISIVFKYLALIMLVFLVIFFFIAMIPGFEQVLGNAGKKIIQFVFMGGLGLFGVRAFLFVNGLIEGAAGGMSKVYFWVAIIQGIIWFVIWRCRAMVMNLLVKGTLSAQEVGRKVQGNLEHFYQPDLISKMNPFTPTRTIDRSGSSVPDMAMGTSSDVAPAVSSAASMPLNRTLFRATKNSLASGGKRLMQEFDNLRYGTGESLDKQVALERRAAFKQRLLDRKDDLHHLATLPKAERLRSKLHDLAGDTNAPVQVAFEEREKQRLERKERKEQRRQEQVDFRHYQKSQQPSDDRSISSIIENQLVKPQVRREFHRERLKRQQTPVQSTKPLKNELIVEKEPTVSDELFHKRK